MSKLHRYQGSDFLHRWKFTTIRDSRKPVYVSSRARLFTTTEERWCNIRSIIEFMLKTALKVRLHACAFYAYFIPFEVCTSRLYCTRINEKNSWVKQTQRLKTLNLLLPGWWWRKCPRWHIHGWYIRSRSGIPAISRERANQKQTTPSSGNQCNNSILISIHCNQPTDRVSND